MLFLKIDLQFKQSLPTGFERIGLWPTELFEQIAPPRSPEDLKQRARSRSNDSNPPPPHYPYP